MQIWSVRVEWEWNSFIHNSSLRLFLVIVKKSKHKLLLLLVLLNLLCNNMCSGLRINDLVISPSLDVTLHLLTTRSAFGLNSFYFFYFALLCKHLRFTLPFNRIFDLKKSLKNLTVHVTQWCNSFYWATRNAVNTMMFIKCARLWFSEVIRMFNDSQKGNCLCNWTISIFYYQLNLSWFSFHFFLIYSGNFRPMLDNGQPPLFLPPHFSQFTPPLFSGMKGTFAKFKRRAGIIKTIDSDGFQHITMCRMNKFIWIFNVI